MQITRNSIETRPAPSDWFTGAVYINAAAAPPPGSRVSAGKRLCGSEPLTQAFTFTPGARTAWHAHPAAPSVEG